MGGGVADGGGLTRITGAKEGSLCSQPSRGTALLPPSLNLLNPLRPPSHYWGGKRERKTSSKRKKRRRKEGSPLVCPPSTPFPSLHSPFPRPPPSLYGRSVPATAPEARSFKTTTTDDAAAVTLAAAESQSSVAPAQRGGNRRNGARTTALAPRRRRRQSGRVAEATRIDGVSEAIRE